MRDMAAFSFEREVKQWDQQVRDLMLLELSLMRLAHFRSFRRDRPSPELPAIPCKQKGRVFSLIKGRSCLLSRHE